MAATVRERQEVLVSVKGTRHCNNAFYVSIGDGFFILSVVGVTQKTRRHNYNNMTSVYKF